MQRKIYFIMLLFCLWTILPNHAYPSGLIEPTAGTLDTNRNLVWYNAELLGVEGKGWTDTESYYDRLPIKANGVVREPVWNLSHDCAGMYIRFVTGSDTLFVRWDLTDTESLAMPHMPATGVSGIDLYARDNTGKLRFCANGRPKTGSNEATFELPVSGEYVLYLPLYNGLKQLQIGVPKDRKLYKLPPESPSHSIVFYGTSITQGGCASRPGMAATSIAGRELGAPVINLGFSGNGLMEPEMAELLSELNPAVYVLDCLWNMSLEMVSERVEPFVSKLREIRPDTPILLVEDSNVKNVPTPKGDILREIYAKLKDRGCKNLYLLPNTGMLGEDADGTVDGCHPNDLGMSRQAAVFVKCLGPILEQQQSNQPDADSGK
ncbi:SGNH/GDSL hydrolase family protein [candidate division KSB1 bacterium]|nr:SGNH/GDSL hydrolase family protein [candidate division KSB1 bacterium]